MTAATIITESLVAQIATMEAIMPMMHPIRTNHRRPKMSEKPPERGRAMEVLTVLALSIQL
jgi:hypothetical protein